MNQLMLTGLKQILLEEAKAYILTKTQKEVEH